MAVATLRSAFEAIFKDAAEILKLNKAMVGATALWGLVILVIAVHQEFNEKCSVLNGTAIFGLALIAIAAVLDFVAELMEDSAYTGGSPEERRKYGTPARYEGVFCLYGKSWVFGVGSRLTGVVLLGAETFIRLFGNLSLGFVYIVATLEEWYKDAKPAETSAPETTAPVTTAPGVCSDLCS